MIDLATASQQLRLDHRKALENNRFRRTALAGVLALAVLGLFGLHHAPRAGLPVPSALHAFINHS